ncbi:hypothetical protein CMV_018640 [Castanea mollissima]|uniref:Phorbol-ester/DAG-type domain-containing protein n=1 Tax=Castanea mollissima TaxID=60419 RepID=A0A8J4R1Z6_9ROSI|nr:hypothetical protein CMV_018640 [Castanea mollissima]
MELQHFCHPEHPLIFNEKRIYDTDCYGCDKPILGPNYSCTKCDHFYHHKSCAELPLGLHHPLHPKHPLIIFQSWRYYDNKDYECEICKENQGEYAYHCSHCNFNLHITCASLAPTMEAEVHDHPLTPFWKWITFTCDLCGKKGEGMPYQCNPCGFGIHRECASFLHRVKVVRYKHPLNLIHSLDVHQLDSPFCQLCVQQVDTNYGIYYCYRCDFVAHIHCAMDRRNMEDINLLELKDDENEDLELDQFVHLATYKVKKTIVGEDGIEIATEIEHFSHEHDLKYTYEVINNEKCNGCVRAILPPFYSCAKCSFFLHKSCVDLPRKKRHPLHQHPLTLFPKKPSRRKWFFCNTCSQYCNGFTYRCEGCDFELDVQCFLTLDILTHESHKHRLILSNTGDRQSCSGCGFKSLLVFRCTVCEFALDFNCVELPHTTRYKQHEHPFTLFYIAEDNSGEYYCDICEEERDPNHWFYYCSDCSYPAHPKCILGKYPKCKFEGVYTFSRHPHPLTFVEEPKDHPPCDTCEDPCDEFIYQCVRCNFNIHYFCL